MALSFQIEQTFNKIQDVKTMSFSVNIRLFVQPVPLIFRLVKCQREEQEEIEGGNADVLSFQIFKCF